MSFSFRIDVNGWARERADQRKTRADYSAALSSDVAEVAKRPKKRPGRRERSSITIGATDLPAMVKSGTIPTIYHGAGRPDNDKPALLWGRVR